jgi:hypothetical protein
MLVFEDKVHEGGGLPPLHNLNTIIPATESGANMSLGALQRLSMSFSV